MKTKIMIIEDELRLGNLVSALLQQSGFDTVVETDGERGLKKIKLENPDVILTDVMLPGISGFEICRKIKQNPKFKNIPIITMTGRTDANTQNQALKFGADFFLPKPFNTQFLIKMIQSINQNVTHRKASKKSWGFKFLSLFFFSLIFLNNISFASPWVQLPGRSYHEIQVGSFQGQNNSFQKQQMQYYGEYGLGSGFAILTNVFSGTLNQQPFTQGEAGFGWQIWKDDWHSLSLQQWLSNPAVISVPVPANQALESETRLAVGGSFEKLPLFWSFEPGLRWRNAPAANQWVLRGVVGYRGIKPLEILGEYDQTTSQSFNSGNLDYNLQQISLKIIWPVSSQFSAALRLVSDLNAQNLSQSSGFNLAVISKL